MSILKEFKIAIGLESEDLEKGIKNSEASLKSLGKVAGSVFASFAGYNALKQAISSFSDFSSKIGHTSRLMGYSIEDVHALGNALKRFGGSEDSAISSLNSLTHALSEARYGGGALIDVAKKFGISFLDANGKMMNSETLLMSLGKQIKGLDRLSQIEIGKKLGLDDSVLLALKDGGSELTKLIRRQKELGVVTKKDYKIAQEFGNAWEELKESFKNLSYVLGRTILPPLKKMIELFTSFIDFFRRNKALMIGFFAGLAVAISPLIIGFSKMALASVTAFAPFYAVIGAITAIALVIEDIYGYFKGWDTITGKLADRFPLIKSALESIKPAILGLEKAFNSIVNWVKDPSWEGLIDRFKALGNIILDFLVKPLELVKDLFSNIITNIGSFFKETFSGLLGLNKQPEISSSTSSPNNNYNITANVNQNITSPTPKALADSTAGSILNSIKAQRNMIGSN